MTTAETRTNERRALLAAGVTIVLWASAFVAIRDVATTFSPGSTALGRLATAVLALTPLLLRQGWQPVARRDLGLIVGSGLFWYALYFLVLNEAERHVDAGTAAMLVNTGPIFLGVFAALILKEGLPARLLAGLGIAFVGSVVVGFATSESSTAGDGTLIGTVLCIVAAVSYAVGVTLQKPASGNVPALQLTWIACFAGFLACVPFAPTLISEAATAPLPMLGWLVYLGLFPTALGFTTWAYALRRTSAARLGATTYLVPPTVIVMAWLLLGETPPPLALVGGAICIAGVIVVRTPSLRVPGRSRVAAPAD
jgi:drug/metabolite transporter (DMT)-like permease